MHSKHVPDLIPFFKKTTFSNHQPTTKGVGQIRDNQRTAKIHMDLPAPFLEKSTFVMAHK